MVFRSFAEAAPSRVDNTYMLSLANTSGNGLAAITSADELLVVDRQNISADLILTFSDVPKGVNSLKVLDENSIVCAGGNGVVAIFDLRTQKRVRSFKSQRAVTALACQDSKIGIGTEFASQQAVVSVWDVRSSKQLWQNAENNEDITCLEFHPDKDNVLLAGGDDGLVSLYDTAIVEEDDSLLQVINHSPVHLAGFLGGNRVYAVSSDQNLAIHPVSSSGDEEDPEPTRIGDLRPLIPCQYVIDVVKSGTDFVIAAGTNIDASRVDLIKVNGAVDCSKTPSLALAQRYGLEPAHGEEVVRSIVVDESKGVIYTAGEDGRIRASREHADDSGEADVPPDIKSRNSKKKTTS
ncbi:hypothetical protein LTR66_017304, partial [Elasticomyces elasticus]